MADVANTTIRWGGTPEASLAGFEPVVQAGKTFKVGPIGGELYDTNRAAIQAEQLGNQAIAKGKQDLAKGAAESTVLKNTMALLGDDATEFDMQSAKQYAATFGTVPIDPKTGRIDKITMHGNLEKYNMLRINSELAKASGAGFKSEKTTKEIDGRIYEVMVHVNAQGQKVGETVLGEKRKSIADLEGSQQKELSGYTTIMQDLNEFENSYNNSAAKIKSVVGTGKVGELLFPVGGVIQKFNIWDRDAQKQQALSKAILSGLSRTLGAEVGNMSDSDIARWAASVPQSYTTPQVAKHLFDTLRVRVRRAALDKLELMDAGGVSMSSKASQLFDATPEQWANYVNGARQGKRGLKYLTGEEEVMPIDSSLSSGGELGGGAAPRKPGVYLIGGKLVTVGSDGSTTEGATSEAPAGATPAVAQVTPTTGQKVGAGLANFTDPITLAKSIASGSLGQTVIQPAVSAIANIEPPQAAAGLGRAIVDLIRPLYNAVNNVQTVPLSSVPVQPRPAGIPPAGLMPPGMPLQGQGFMANPLSALPQVPIMPASPQDAALNYLRGIGQLPQSQFINY
jgi:hypothetical protein